MSLGYRIVRRSAMSTADERAEVLAGLADRPARISPKFFYDDLGCALYGAICRLPEYYPTRTEVAIFRDHRLAISEAIGRNVQLVDLGAGDCCKAESWLAFVHPARYVAVDIAEAQIDQALARLSANFPEIEMLGIVTDFARDLAIDDLLVEMPTTFFYPGSSIGNFTPEAATAFLAGIRKLCVRRPGSGLLIGVDGKKEKSRLDAAYDDALGVTSAFNLNVLLHLNRRFGFDFTLGGYAHRGFYNEDLGRVEMHLESLRDQVVRAGDFERRFMPGDLIHTENSYKYRPEEFSALLRSAGFGAIRTWTSDDGGYSVFFAA